MQLETLAQHSAARSDLASRYSIEGLLDTPFFTLDTEVIDQFFASLERLQSPAREQAFVDFCLANQVCGE